MKVKVNITLELPPEYNWIACQPYGHWLAFKRKPKIHVAWEDREQDGFVPRYWALQKDELDLSDHGPQAKNWRKSLRRIKR